MAKYLPLPDGSFYEVADDVSLLDAQRQARTKFPKLYGMEGEKGFGAALKQGLGSIASSGATAFEALTGDATKAGQRALARSQEDALRYEEQIGLEKLKKEYEKGGIFAGAKEIVRQAPLAIAEQLPNLGASAAGAYGGAALGTAILPGVGTVLGGGLGAFAPSYIQALGGNIERQIAEQRKAGQEEKADIGSAKSSAVAQGALDTVGNFIPLGKGAIRTVLGKDGIEGVKTMFGTKVGGMLAGDNIAAANKLANESFKKTLAKGTAVGLLAEVPTEVAQQMFERGQAGLDLFTPDALNEYIATAYQVGLLAPIGAGGRFVDKSGAKGVVAADEAKQAQVRADEAEKTRLASPEYYDQLETERTRLETQLDKMKAGLEKSKNPEALQEKITGVQDQLTTVSEQLAAHPLFEERKAKAYEQEATGKTLGMFQEWQNQAQADLLAQEQRAAVGVPEAVQTLPGMEQITPMPAPQVPDINAIKTERDTLSTQLEQLQKGLTQAAISGNTPAITEIQKQIDLLSPAIAELESMVKNDPQAKLAKLTRSLTKAGEEGDFEKIKTLAQEIESLKAQGVTLPETPAYDQKQTRLFTKEGETTPEARRGVRLGEEVKATREKEAADTALEQAQQDLLGLGYTNKYRMTPEERVAKGVEGYKASLEELEEAYKATEDERTVGRLVDLLSKGGAKEEESAGIADTSLQPQQHKFRASEAKGAADEAFMRFSEALGDIKDGTYLMRPASTSKSLLLKKADQAKRDYIEAVLQEVDNSRLAQRHNSLTQGQALQLAMQIHTAMDRNLKAGTVEPQLEQHLTQYRQPYYKPTTQKAFGLTMQTEKSLAKKVAREEAGKEKELTEEEQAVRREAMRTEEGGKGIQKTLPGIEPIATERATPANFMKFLNSAEVAKLRRNVEAEKARDAEIGRLIKASIRKDQEKYNALETKREVETGKLREALADITELERKDAVYIAEQKLNEAIKKAEQDFMQGMEVLGPVINQAQRELAKVEPNVTVAADRAIANRLRSWLNEAYDLRDKYASRVETLRKSRVEVDEHKVRRDAILSDYIQNRKKALDKLDAEIKAKPLGPVARKAEAQRAKIAIAEKALKDRNEAQDKQRRDREQAELEFAERSKEYGQKVETATTWDPNIGEYVEAKGTKGEVLKRKVESGRNKSAETRAVEAKEAQRAAAEDRLQSKQTRIERLEKGLSTSADQIADDLNKVAAELKRTDLKPEEKQKLAQRQKQLKQYQKLIKAGNQVVRISEAPAPKRGELRTARKERTEPEAAPKKFTGVTPRAAAAIKAEREAEVYEASYEDTQYIQQTFLRDSGAKPTKVVNAAEAQASMDKVSAKLNKAGIKFEYYPTLESIPAKLKKVLAAKKSEGAKGMILPDGTIVVIGDMHENTRDLQKTVAHEVIGHHGVEGAIGENGINALADRVFSKEGRIFEIAKALGVSDDVAGAARAAKAMGLSEKETQALMVRELIAHTAEAKAKGEGAVETVKAWVRDVIAAVRSWFNSIGLDQVGKDTTKEIQSLIKDAQKRFEANEAPVYKSANGDVHFRSKTKYNENFSPSLRQGVQDVIGSDPSFIDKVKSNVLGMAGQIQWADRFAGLQHIADNVMKRSLGAMQMMYWNRTYDARNQLLGDVVRNGAPIIKEQQYKNTKEVERVIGKGDNKASIENVTKILARAKNDFGSVDAAFEMFTLYRIAKRAKRVGLEKAFGFDMTPEERTKYQALVNEAWATGESNAHIKEASKEYNDYNRALMEFLAASGAITKEEAHSLTKDNDYIGFYREHNGFIVDGEHAIKIGDLTTQPFLRELVGSNKRIQDFRVSALQNTSLILDIALHNLATKDTAYTLSTIGLAKVNKGHGPASPNTVRFKQNGQDMYATIDTDSVGIPTDLMMKGLKGISTSLPAALKFMGKPAQLLRKGVTRLPAYAARQLFRDSLHSVIVGGVNAKPVVSATKEFMNLMGSRGKENEIERVLSEKGFIGGQVYSGDVSDIMREMNRLSGGGRNWDSAMAWLDNMGIQADAASRVVAYRSYREQGMSDMEASLQSLETMNFTKRGISPSMNALSIMIPFFNAQVQALYNLGRVATGKMTGEKELQLKAKFIKRGLMMAGMSMIYAAAMEDDDTYKDASPRDKYMNWFIPIPGLDEPFKLPIPFEAGYIFKAVPEMLFNLAFTDEKAGNAGKALKDMLVQSVPGLNNLFLPQAARPLVSTIFNYDPFTQSAVESTKLQKMEVAQRAKDTTSETARTLAGIYDTVGLNNLVEMSPVKIDYLVRNYLGGAGTLALVVADAATSPFRDQNAEAAEKKLSQTPIIGGFFQNTSGSGVIGNAFDTMERITETKQTYNDMVAKGRLTQAQEYAKENERTLLEGVQSKAGSFRQQMGKFATAKSAIQSSPNLSPAEKRERIDLIQKQMRDFARTFRDEMAQLKVGE